MVRQRRGICGTQLPRFISEMIQDGTLIGTRMQYAIYQKVPFQMTLTVVLSRAVWHGFKKPRFVRFFKKNLKNLKSPNLGFLGFKKNKNLMSDLSF